MSASDWDIWKHSVNVIKRASYGVSGQRQYDRQKERMINMAAGGGGGTLDKTIMSDTSGHEGSARELHFSDWNDEDFQKVVDLLNHWEKTSEIPVEPTDDIDNDTQVKEAVAQAHAVLKNLDRDDRIEALNALAEGLGVMEPDDEN